MDSFNSKEYAYIDVQVVILGRLVTGLRGVAYEVTTDMAALYGSGKYALSIQRGKKVYTGTITLLQSEVIALTAAAKSAGGQDITDLDFDMIVAYAPDSGIITTDKVIGAAITKVAKEMKEGDLQQEIALPFLALRIDDNVS